VLEEEHLDGHGLHSLQLLNISAPSFSLVENRSNIARHQGTSFKELMLIHHLEALPRTKARSE